MTEEQRDIQMLKHEVLQLTDLVEELTGLLVTSPITHDEYYVCHCGNPLAMIRPDRTIPYLGCEVNCSNCGRRINWKGIKL